MAIMKLADYRSRRIFASDNDLDKNIIYTVYKSLSE